LLQSTFQPTDADGVAPWGPKGRPGPHFGRVSGSRAARGIDETKLAA